MKDKILRILFFIQSLGFMKALKLLWLTHISTQHAGSKDKMFRSLNRKHGIIREFIDRNLAFARYGLFKDSTISLIAPPDYKIGARQMHAKYYGYFGGKARIRCLML